MMRFKVFKMNREWHFVFNVLGWQFRAEKDGYRPSLHIVLEKEHCQMRDHNEWLKRERPVRARDDDKLYHGGLCYDCSYLCDARIADWSSAR